MADTSREARQKAQLEANQKQAEAFEAAQQGSGGGAFGTGGYGAPRTGGGPTWSDSPAGKVLQDEYRKSGVVFGPKGDILYNPADLGSAQVEAVRAARGEAPSFKQSGAPSQKYLNSINEAGVNAQALINSNSRQAALSRLKAERQAELSAVEKGLPAIQNLYDIYTDNKNVGRNNSEIISFSAIRSQTIDDYRRTVDRQKNLQKEIANIDSALGITAKQKTTASLEKIGLAPESGAKAGVKKIITPVDNTPLAGSTITARQLKAAKTQAQKDRLAFQAADEQAFGEFFKPAAEPTPRKERARIQSGQDSINLFGNPAFFDKGDVRRQTGAPVPTTQVKKENVVDSFFNAVDNQFGGLPKMSGGLPLLPEAFAQTSSDVQTSNKKAISDVRNTVRQAKAAGATTIDITDQSGFTKTVPIARGELEALKALKQKQNITLSAQGAARTEYTVSLTESLNLGDSGILANGVSPDTRQVKSADVIGVNPISDFIDRTFQLGQPKETRSTQSRIKEVPSPIYKSILGPLGSLALDSPATVGEKTAPLANFGALLYDAGRQAVAAAQGKQIFDENNRAGALNLPQVKSEYVTPTQRTAIGDILEGKPVDPKTLRSSLEGEVIFGAVQALAAGAGLKGTQGAKTKIQQSKDVRAIKSKLEETLPAIQTDQAFKPVEPTISKKGTTEFTKNTIFENIIPKTQKQKPDLRVTPRKGTPGIYDIEVTNANANKRLSMQKTGKNEFDYVTLENPNLEFGRPTGLDIYGNVGKAEQERFNLIPTTTPNKFVSKGAPTQDALASLASDIVKPVAREKTFTAQQVKENPLDFGAYFFTKTRPGYTPSTPFTDIILGETKYNRLVGSKVGQGGLLSDSPFRLQIFKGRKGARAIGEQTPDVFTTFEESTVRTGRFGREKFRKRKTVDSFVFDVRQNVKNDVDPFADLTKTGISDTSLLDSILGRKPKRRTSSTPFSFSDDNKAQTGKSKQLTTQELKTVQDDILTKPPETTKTKSEPFGYAMAPLSQDSTYDGSFEDLSFPPGTNFGNRPKRNDRRGIISLGPAALSDSVFNDLLNPKSKLKNNLSFNPTIKDRSDLGAISLSGLDIVQDAGTAIIQKTNPITDQSQKQGQKEITISKQKEVPVGKTTYTPPGEDIFTPKGKPGKGGFIFPRLGGGFGSGEGRQRKRGKKLFEIDTGIDPLQPGTIDAAFAKGVLSSRSSDIFGIGERVVIRSRKKRGIASKLNQRFDAIAGPFSTNNRVKDNLADYNFGFGTQKGSSKSSIGLGIGLGAGVGIGKASKKKKKSKGYDFGGFGI
jgi:hypothetical protein